MAKNSTKYTEYRILPLIMPNGDDSVTDINKIRNFCSQGLSECPPEDRFAAWLVLLNIFPSNPCEWHSIRDELVTTYKDFISLFGLDDWNTKIVPKAAQVGFFEVQNPKLMWQIHGDIVRSSHHIYFLPPIPTNADTDDIMQNSFREHMRRIERILYIFGQVQPSVNYAQGFNELLIPLYFVANSGASFLNDDIDEIEAVAFKMLLQLLLPTGLHQLYTTEDNSSIIMNTLNQFELLLAHELPKAFSVIKKFDIHPLAYCYRWFSLLFAQEHEIPTMLIIWDSLFAHYDDFVQFLFYIGIAHIRVIEDKLSIDNYTETMQVLQNPYIQNIFPVLKDANQMFINSKEPKQESLFSKKGLLSLIGIN